MSDGLDDAVDTTAEHVAASAADPATSGAKARPSRAAALRPDANPGHCANCDTRLEGAVCHNCGQLDDEFHRPVRGLAGEIVEGLVALDGRVARTIPNLLLRPGRVTRAYLKGQRARFMPPFRLYIIASLIFFLLAPALGDLFQASDSQTRNATIGTASMVDQEIRNAIASAGGVENYITTEEQAGRITAEEAASLRRAASFFNLDTQGDETAGEQAAEPQAGSVESEGVTGADPPNQIDAMAEPDASPASDTGTEQGTGADEASSETSEADGTTTAQAMREYLVPEEFGGQAMPGTLSLGMRTFLADRLERVIEDPRRWLREAADWVPRIMFVMVPVYALLLSLTYAWRRGYFLYDHLIVSVHFHAALFLSMTIFYLFSYLLSGPLMVLAWIIYSHYYLYKLHRVVYERRRFVSILRTLTLSIVYGFVLSLGLFATLLLGALVV